MKKLFALALALCLAAALCACGNSKTKDTGIYAEDGIGQGTVGDVMHTYFFDFTVNSVHFADTYESYVPTSGNQMMIAEVTVTNTVSDTLPMFDTDFQAQWNDDADDAYAWPITLDPVTYEDVGTLSDEQLPGVYSIDAGKSVTGLLVYEVPAGYDAYSVSYLEMFDNDTTGDVFFVTFEG